MNIEVDKDRINHPFLSISAVVLLYKGQHMQIQAFIQEILLKRLQDSSVLIVYDPVHRYRALCLDLATPECQVVDASESSIESREAALTVLQRLGQGNQLLVYVPTKAPLTDEEKQMDPFAIYGECGATFPDPEYDRDEYRTLCLMAKPDYTTELHRIFAENPNPSFAIIDAVGGGAGWPILQALLRVESARDILFALLAPSEQQREALKADTTDSWVTEAKTLFSNALGLKLMTRGKSWSALADELWRFLLFSEFVFDLPVALPETLVSVPHAQREAQPLIEYLCDLLRNDQRTQALYIERAERLESKEELNLRVACAAIADLGQRETFPFEERSVFAQAVDAFQRDNVDKLRQILNGRKKSVWSGRGESQSQWQLLRTAANLVQSCEDAERQLPDYSRSQDSLLDFYIGSLREVDRLHREFEQAAGDHYGESEEQITKVKNQARRAYRRLSDRVQELFIRHLEKAGWPPGSRLANADLFDKIVTPRLQESGQRVALLLVDALRYELGVALQQQLSSEGQVELQAAFAQLPTITPVGMASLLPGAGQGLILRRKESSILPMLGDQPLATVTQRMDILRKRYGQRFAEIRLNDFVRGKNALPETVELLVIRSNEMDNDFESNPEAAPSLISRTFQQIRSALRKLRTLGFHDAIIATDHGFYLNTAMEAGDKCAKPTGNWVILHDRFVLGVGAVDAANLILPTAHLGIRGDFSEAGCPRTLIAYQSGISYFHGGASLQETVVPVISIRLATVSHTPTGRQPTVTLAYKRGAKRITTRLPIIELAVGAGDLFSQDATVDILLEARDKQDRIVGEAKPGEHVNPATRLLSLYPGTTVGVTLKMDLEFEGKFTVKALDPTTLKTYHKLDLETDYTV